MDYKVLYRKYRPKNFAELVGQNSIRELLLNSIINKKLSHAYIFTGPRGTGKTSTAKIFAKTVNCENLIDNNPCEKCSFCLSYNDSPDIIEIDAASNNGVDEIREIRENIKILPNSAKYKIYIIDEVHMLSASAWNAFLKTLEEPPGHVIFILATTEIQKVPITVLSRCQRFDFQRISENIITELLTKIIEKEEIDISKEATEEIAKLSDGGLRDALSILDQLSKLNSKITISTIKEAYGIITIKEINELFDSYLANQIVQVVNQIDNFKSSGVDSNILITKMLEFLLDLLIKNKVNSYSVFPEIENLIEELEKCYYKSNKYILIKATLIKNMNIKEQIISNELEDIQILGKNVQPVISREIILNNENQKVTEEIIRVRVNNSFVAAEIELKKEFLKTWKKFLNSLFEKNELKLGSLLKEATVEVVSPTNVLLSTESYSNSILLNSMSEQVSMNLEKDYNLSVKVVCLDIIRWTDEKSNYIKNKKSKKYELMLEPDITIEEDIVNSAENLFGDDLVEIN